MTDPNNVKTIFLAASEKPAVERATFLEQAVGGDIILRARVEALLKAHDNPDSFLNEAAAEFGATIDLSPAEHPLSERPGTLIGPYKLLEQIGEGGMGVVFMAKQTEPLQRTVALKIIKPGMDTRQVIARFEAERQALTLMDHPNIARVLDAGTTDTGRPYFVMDLVKGVPITEYCDAHHISVPQRLELMVAVCQAVHHAHQKGIIHRDIKPSNVLVAEYDGRPVPKIIDFGVAKATAQQLTEKTVFTQYGQIVGTFEYMSPEQARFNQLDVDTRSDIYSLGVLLYELLAGNTPLEKERLRSAAFDEILRIIRDEDPPRPSARLSSSESLPSIAANRSLEPKKLAGLVSGELDWIVMKCLEKEREKRYASAHQVAEECRRFLAGEPIQARPVTTRQRMWRWYCRHVSFVAGAYTVFTFLIIALEYIVFFSLLQFLVLDPNTSDLLIGFGTTVVMVLICLYVMKQGAEAFQGKRAGLWLSLLAFLVLCLYQWVFLYMGLAINGEFRLAPVESSKVLNPAAIAQRDNYIWRCVVGFNVMGIVWPVVGLALQLHALCSRDAAQTAMLRAANLSAKHKRPLST